MRINIKQLEIASCLYHHFSSYDESYEIVRYLSRKSSLSDKDLKSLIEWLRAWGCRQFEKSHSGISRTSMIQWIIAKKKEPPKNSSHNTEF